MATLEQITRDTAVKGILPEGLVTISDVRWIGTVAIEVAYKDAGGKLGNELAQEVLVHPAEDIPLAGLLVYCFSRKWSNGLLA